MTLATHLSDLDAAESARSATVTTRPQWSDDELRTQMRESGRQMHRDMAALQRKYGEFEYDAG